MIADLKCYTVDDQQLINEVQNWSNIIISHVIQNDQQYYKIADHGRPEETIADYSSPKEPMAAQDLQWFDWVV